MDFRKLYQSGENNVNNDDIMFMQYSNYFGISAIGKGLDPSNSGLTVAGCNILATHNTTDDTLTVSLSDGYIIINGKQTKCESTEAIQFAFQYYMNYRRSAYIFAEVQTNYNPLGLKLYGDGSQRYSWLENRIKLSYSFSGSNQTGKVLLGYITVGGAQGGTPGPVVIKTSIPNLGQAVVRETGNNDIVNTHRGGRDFECVSVSNLYNAFNDWSIKSIGSSTRSNDGSFVFTIPADTDVFLLSAKGTLTSDTNYQFSSGISSDNYNYFINKKSNTLIVAFNDNNIMSYATCLIAYNSIQ